MVALAGEVWAAVGRGLGEIRTIAARARMLALNALIEAARADEAGRGSTVMADDVKAIGGLIDDVTAALGNDLARALDGRGWVGDGLVAPVHGQHRVDLARNGIEIIHCNLYEPTFQRAVGLLRACRAEQIVAATASLLGASTPVDLMDDAAAAPDTCGATNRSVG